MNLNKSLLNIVESYSVALPQHSPSLLCRRSHSYEFGIYFYACLFVFPVWDSQTIPYISLNNEVIIFYAFKSSVHGFIKQYISSVSYFYYALRFICVDTYRSSSLIFIVI